MAPLRVTRDHARSSFAPTFFIHKHGYEKRLPAWPGSMGKRQMLLDIDQFELLRPDEPLRGPHEGLQAGLFDGALDFDFLVDIHAQASIAR